jgi:SAM-dependent methyltransferase
MDLTNAERLVLLSKHLVASPSYISRYFKHNLIDLACRHRMPIDLELPWFSYGAIDYLSRRLIQTSDLTVFEYGCGGSTLFFARRCRSVSCVEDDKLWLQVVVQRVKDLAINNVTVVYQPFDFHHPEGFEQSKYLSEIDGATYDIIVVDGQDWSFNERPVCFRRAEGRVRPGGMIILDDSWRSTYTALRANSHARQVEVFEGPGPMRYGVTSTDIYLY